MAFSRPLPLTARPSAQPLTADMAGIGMAFSARPSANPQIEPTLVAASEVGMLDHDLRTLSLLTTWLGIHMPYVNVARLARHLKTHPAPRVLAYWDSVAEWLGRDRRLAKLRGLHEGDRFDILPIGTEFQLRRRGEDERFQGTQIRSPRGVLRDRVGDVATPAELARDHVTYRARVVMGPTWRADAWSALEQNPALNPSQIGRSVGCSFATAWRVKRDFELIRLTAILPAG